MSGLKLEIITPELALRYEDVDYVGATGLEGEFGILPQHMPMLVALRPGRLYYRIKDKTCYAFVGGGFVETLDNKVSVLAEVAELAENIDCERAKAAKERAEKRLHGEAQIDAVRAKAALNRAISRLNIAGLIQA